MHTPEVSDAISEIISEFSEVFAFSRTRWSKSASEINSELSGVSWIVLQVVYRKGPITATEIAQMLDMDKSLVSRHVSKLRDLGHVDTVASAEDRRVQLLTASADAAELLAGVRERWANAYRERLAEWSPAELETLRSGLHRFNALTGEATLDGPAGRCTRHAAEETSAAGSDTH